MHNSTFYNTIWLHAQYIHCICCACSTCLSQRGRQAEVPLVQKSQLKEGRARLSQPTAERNSYYPPLMAIGHWLAGLLPPADNRPLAGRSAATSRQSPIGWQVCCHHPRARSIQQHNSHDSAAATECLNLLWSRQRLLSLAEMTSDAFYL